MTLLSNVTEPVIKINNGNSKVGEATFTGRFHPHTQQPIYTQTFIVAPLSADLNYATGLTGVHCCAVVNHVFTTSTGNNITQSYSFYNSTTSEYRVWCKSTGSVIYIRRGSTAITAITVELEFCKVTDMGLNGSPAPSQVRGLEYKTVAATAANGWRPWDGHAEDPIPHVVTGNILNSVSIALATTPGTAYGGSDYHDPFLYCRMTYNYPGYSGKRESISLANGSVYKSFRSYVSTKYTATRRLLQSYYHEDTRMCYFYINSVLMYSFSYSTTVAFQGLFYRGSHEGYTTTGTTLYGGSAFINVTPDMLPWFGLPLIT